MADASDASPSRGVTRETLSAGSPPSTEVPDRTWLLPGASFGRYTVLDRLGEGGMGVVYKAYDPVLDRAVALKLLVHAGEPERLLREAQSLARLSHPNVLVVFEAGLVDGIPFLTMEYVDGKTLHAWAKASPRRREEVLARYHDAGRGLLAAHRAGLVHRDFKPQNVLVGDDGRVRVADFGVARDVETPAGGAASGADGSLTVPGRIMGTPAYMAPEQARGERADAASDQYSYCVSLFEGLCGLRPGEPEADHIAASLPASLRRALARGTSADPAQRFPDMEALLAAIYDAPAQRRRRLLLLGGALLVPLVAVAAVSLRSAEPPPCRTGAARVARIWDQAARDTITARFARSPLAYARDVAGRTVSRIDTYAAGLAAARDEVCAATAVRHEQSEALLDLRVACLERRLGGLSHVRDLLADADDAVIMNAPKAVDGLEDLAACDDVQTLTASWPRPRDPEARTRLAALEDRLARAKVLIDAARQTVALPQLEAIVAEARVAGWWAPLAEGALLLGRARVRLDAYPSGAAAYREAIDAADAARDDRVRLAAVLKLLEVEGYWMEHTDQIDALEARARALLTRLGEPPALRADLLDSFANTEINFRLDRARVYADEMIAIRGRILDHDDQLYGRSLRTIGRVAERQGQIEVALAYLRPAAAIMERHLGHDHPDNGFYLHNLGNLLSARGDYEEALAIYRRGYALTVAAFGEWNDGAARTLGNIGSTLVNLGRNDEALDTLRRALAVHERKAGADSLLTGGERTRIADLLLMMGRPAEAAPEAERAEAICRAHEASAGCGYTHAVLARVKAAQGDTRAARVSFDEAVAVVEGVEGKSTPTLIGLLVSRGRFLGAGGVADVERALALVPAGQTTAEQADATLALAETLWARGSREDRTRAVALAKQVNETAPGPLREPARSWLAAHAP